MLTIFSTPKPFIGHIKIIQRNALKSWALLHPDVEVILFGDEEGAAEACKEFGIRHEPYVRRHHMGPKYLNYFFDRAQEIAKHSSLCYVNCDIILMSDFRSAVEQVCAKWTEFLMVGRRWNSDIGAPLHFETPMWEEHLRSFVLRHGACQSPGWIDYFVFSKNLYLHRVPPFVIGRGGWDPWLIWKAIDSDAAIIDASKMVVAVHQNHDYSYLTQNSKTATGDALTKRNLQLSGSWLHWQATDSAGYALTSAGVRRRYFRRWLVPFRQRLHLWASMALFCLLNVTRTVRHNFGIRRRSKVMLRYRQPGGEGGV